MVAIMFGAIVLAALAVSGVFSAAGLVPTERPEIESIAARGIEWNYTTVLNIVFGLVAAALVWLTVRRGARDPVCGMTVDRFAAKHRTVHAGREYVFCGPGCKRKFDEDPGRYVAGGRRETAAAH
jgi:YHS domain-containing protein